MPVTSVRLPVLAHGTPVTGLKGTKHNDPADLNITPASVTTYLTTPCGSALMPTLPAEVAPLGFSGLTKAKSPISDLTASQLKSNLVVSLKNRIAFPSKPFMSASTLLFFDPASTMDEINIPSVVFWK